MTPELILTDVTTGRRHRVPVRRVVIVGFAGRDRDAVRAHIQELSEIGVPVPSSTPTFYSVDPARVTTADRIHVSGAFTSGEVEPVVMQTVDGWLLTVGSDHTDRDLETVSIAESKAACAKPVARGCIPADRVGDWDGVTIRSWADEVIYQVGSLADLLPLSSIVAAASREGLEIAPGDLLFLGTVPVHGPLRPATTFRIAMDAAGHRVEATYRVAHLEGGADAKG